MTLNKVSERKIKEIEAEFKSNKDAVKPKEKGYSVLHDIPNDKSLWAAVLNTYLDDAAIPDPDPNWTDPDDIEATQEYQEYCEEFYKDPEKRFNELYEQACGEGCFYMCAMFQVKHSIFLKRMVDLRNIARYTGEVK